MNMSINTKRILFEILANWTVWSIAVFIAIMLIAESPFDAPHFVESIIGGVLGGPSFYFIESSKFLYSLTRKLAVWQIIIIRAGTYKLSIVLITSIMAGIHTGLYENISVWDFYFKGHLTEFLESANFSIILPTMVGISFLLSFFREIARMLGPGVFLKLLIGSYHKPTEEERIFMFLDLNNSTKLAEELGPFLFSEFKNEFFFDIAEPVIETRGEVFQYVGDEVVLTWKLKSGLKNANWLRCFYFIKEKVEKKEEKYRARYNVKPEFKAGCHCGKVFSSEVGDLKRGIVYSGDAVNTASRIEGECKKLKKELLVSQNLMNRTNVNGDYTSEFLGEIELRGKQKKVSLLSINKN